jgi:DNA-binding ferritin-like protein
MPFRHTDKGWFWGSKGPFPTKAKAIQVATAAHASGFKEESEMDKNTIAEFVGTLLHSATIVHFMHLQTKSYSVHKALQKYYESIVDGADTIAEAIQGCTGELIAPYPSMFGNPEVEPLDYLTSIRDYVTVTRKDIFPEYSNIQNEIDAVMTLLDSTIYRLTFLK